MARRGIFVRTKEVAFLECDQHPKRGSGPETRADRSSDSGLKRPLAGDDGQAGTSLDVIDDKAARDDGTRMQAAGHRRTSDGRSLDPSTRLHRK